ncbi:RNA 2',3'-cyclic phosphodiesterase [Patulibacter minatonensis]|uniref:RNA 2',3'-cyclic phosphodiesterase n=1 Tax=Patulibacter minatonensis TaxID=298163 RepID=UPI00047B5E50|nr:RNA 2',3'-cyclic phosphodiesterase [Patulibacter minatonensis]
MARSRPGSAGPRLFVALDPPDDVRETLTAWLRAQRAVHGFVRSVPAENLHLTLAFLGARPPDELERIARVVADVGDVSSALGLSTGAPVWLPPKRPTALAVEVHDDRGDLAELHTSLADALRDAIGWSEDRPFRPHVTVGRRTASTPLPKLRLEPTPAIAFDGAALVLYRSTLDPDGARYAAVERVDLG